MSKVQVLALLTKLKPEELAEIERAIKAIQGLNKSSVVASGQHMSDGDYLLEGIAQYLVQIGVLAETSRAVYHLQRRDAYKQYKIKRPELEGFLNKILKSIDGGRGNRYQGQLAFLAASSLADMLKARNIFSVGTMLSQVDKIPEALDFAFPGYVEGSMFRFVMLGSVK